MWLHALIYEPPYLYATFMACFGIAVEVEE